MGRLMIRLEAEECVALWRLAQQERRDPRDQAALIIRQELERRGLLDTPETDERNDEYDNAWRRLCFRLDLPTASTVEDVISAAGNKAP